MNDYWNDPPDDVEVPSKCPHCGSTDTVIVTLNNQFACENCNAIIECEPDPEPPYDTLEEKEEVFIEECAQGMRDGKGITLPLPRGSRASPESSPDP